MTQENQKETRSDKWIVCLEKERSFGEHDARVSPTPRPPSSFPEPHREQRVYATQYRSIGLNQRINERPSAARVLMRARLMVIENVLRLSLAGRPSIEWTEKSRFARIFARSRRSLLDAAPFAAISLYVFDCYESETGGGKTSLVPFNKIDYLRCNKSYHSLMIDISSSFFFFNQNYEIYIAFNFAIHVRYLSIYF